MIGKVGGNHYRIQSQLVCEGGGDEGQDQKLSEIQNRQHNLECLSPFDYRIHLKTVEVGLLLIAVSRNRVVQSKFFSSFGYRYWARVVSRV